MKTEDNFLGNLPLELAHALFRVARPFHSQELKARIEAWGIKFLESTALSDPKSTASDIHILERLIILGETIGEIPYHSSAVLYAQFANIKSAIRQYQEELVANSAIDRLFTQSETEIYHKGTVVATPLMEHPIEKVTEKVNEYDNTTPITLSEFNSQVNNLDFIKFGNDYKKELNKKKGVGEMPKKYDLGTTSERQRLIVQKVRQLGNTAMKDLIAEFPSVSERTIRYDLQKLCELLILERKGNGGPASFYRLREVGSPTISA